LATESYLRMTQDQNIILNNVELRQLVDVGRVRPRCPSTEEWIQKKKKKKRKEKCYCLIIIVCHRIRKSRGAQLAHLEFYHPILKERLQEGLFLS
jgi:hypothetical protein